MKIYDLNNPLDEQQYLARAMKLLKEVKPNGRRCVVMLEEKCGRTLKQNSYLHVILAYFGCQYGCSAEEAKTDFFKELVNPQTFVVGEKTDRYTGKTKKVLRHTCDISKEEMTMCIERFRNWCSNTVGIYIPSADERDMIVQMELEVKRNENYL